MPEYGHFCPVSLTTEVLADRWTPLVVRELVLGSTRFNDIARGLPGMSRTLLVQRLRHLEKHGVVERSPGGAGRGPEYHLTPAGRDLEPVIEAFARWAIDWLYDEFRPEEIHPHHLMWWMHRRTDPSRFPDSRVVLEFCFTGPTPTTVWLVLERGEASVCHQHPGFETDVRLRASTATFGGVFNGARTWTDAVRSGDLEVAGPGRYTRSLSTWFRWSPFAPMVRKHLVGA